MPVPKKRQVKKKTVTRKRPDRRHHHPLSRAMAAVAVEFLGDLGVTEEEAVGVIRVGTKLLQRLRAVQEEGRDEE